MPSVTLVGFRLAERPLTGEIDEESDTVPAKPRLVTVIVEVSKEPRGIERVEGLMDTLKPTRWTVTVTV